MADLTLDWRGRRLIVADRIWPTNHPGGMSFREVAEKLGHEETTALVTILMMFVATLCDEKCWNNEFCLSTERGMAVAKWLRDVTGEYERLGIAPALKPLKADG